MQTGVIMLEYINQLRARGSSIEESAIEGAVLRLRPIMMTQTLAQIGADEPVQVASVSDRDPEMLWYFGSQGIKPGIRLTIVEQLPSRGAYRIIVGSSQEAILLSEPIASAIFVSL